MSDSENGSGLPRRPAARTRPGGRDPRSSRGARTRLAVLDAAEAAFAERGFAATRLEDVAAEVGIRRASIVYHFPDKRALYEAVLERAFGTLRDRVERALLGAGPRAERVEAAVGAWVDTVVERPALARLLLREVVDAAEGASPALRAQTAPFAALFAKAVAEGEAEAAREPGPGPAEHDLLDPVQIVSVVVGATVFFVGALPALAPAGSWDPADPTAREAHRRTLRQLVRRLLPVREAATPPRRERPR